MSSFSYVNGLASTPPPTPGTNAPGSATPVTLATPPPPNVTGETNQMFGSPGALTGGAAGKTGITQGPQLTSGAKAGSNLPTNQAMLSNAGLGGGK